MLMLKIGISKCCVLLFGILYSRQRCAFAFIEDLMCVGNYVGLQVCLLQRRLLFCC
jgi:hypothetical protein